MVSISLDNTPEIREMLQGDVARLSADKAASW
jgi:hypothetical protein